MADKSPVAADSAPLFQDRARELIRELSTLSLDEIQTLYKTSDSLTAKTREQIQNFDAAPETPALFAFRGEAFKTLDADSLPPDAVAFANEHLLIFSGLYGLVRPLDGIRPYRLDFNTPLKVAGRGLKAVWKADLNARMAKVLAPGETLVNLASAEYSSILTAPGVREAMVEIQFRERSGDTLKNLAIRAKQARGAMARHIICRGLTRAEELQSAEVDGYTFEPSLSSDREWFFVR